jgi:predicted alpha/beta-fold hydrolase
MGEEITLTIPVQTNEFVPRRGLRNGHAQTLAGNFLRRENILPPPEERIFSVHAEDDAQVMCHCHWQPEQEKHDAITVIVVHGLEGSSESKYVIGTANKAWAKGMNVVRMNMRNCGGTEALSPTLYHSGMSDDLGAVTRTLIQQDGLKRIALVGFSMGGNLVMKLAGEWGRKKNAPRELLAVAGVSPAMDLAPSADALHELQNRIYEWKFLRGLRRRYKRKAALYPDRYDPAHVHGSRTIRDFDHQVTARYSGFTSADDYYTRASSSHVAEFISVPALVIHSTDDPFIRMMPATRAKLLANPNVTYVETNHGGHCAFIAEPSGDDGRWAERMVVEFFERSAVNAEAFQHKEHDESQGSLRKP